MNYNKIYEDLVNKAKSRGNDKIKLVGYFESHHIVPKCLGGSNKKSNLVLLTGREHFIAHMLLWKANPTNKSLARAAFMMSNRKISKVNSKVYENLRKEYSEAVREQCLLENPFKGKKHSEESINKMKAWHRDNPDHGKKNSGWKHSEETRQKLREAHLKRPPVSEETRRKISIAHKGRVKSEQERINISERQKGKKRSPETVEKCKAGFKALDKQPWEVAIVKKYFDKQIPWIYADVFYDFWKLNGEVGEKLLTKNVNSLLGNVVPNLRLKGVVGKFESGWIPLKDQKWLTYRDQNYEPKLHNDFTLLLSKTVKDIEVDFINLWIACRETNRIKILSILEKTGILKSLNQQELSKSNYISPVDVAEANILWLSGKVQKKTIAKLLGVRNNTVSTFTTKGKSWKKITEMSEEIYSLFKQ